MEIPIAVPCHEGMEYKSAEEYTLEQKQEALTTAEQELKKVMEVAEDFFDTKEEMDKTVHEIIQHPDALYMKPFMKKIACAVLRVNACKQELDWASESVVDTSLTPAQVKAQVKQLLDAQRMELDKRFTKMMSNMMSDITMRMELERAEWTTQLRELKEELEEERRNRKAFQAKVKDFSEEIIVSVGHCTKSPIPHTIRVHQIGENCVDTLSGKLRYEKSNHYWSDTYDNAYIYKRAGCTPLPLPTDPTYQTLYDADRVNRDKAYSDFKFTTFDGTEK